MNKSYLLKGAVVDLRRNDIVMKRVPEGWQLYVVFDTTADSVCCHPAECLLDTDPVLYDEVAGYWQHCACRDVIRHLKYGELDDCYVSQECDRVVHKWDRQYPGPAYVINKDKTVSEVTTIAGNPQLFSGSLGRTWFTKREQADEVAAELKRYGRVVIPSV